MNPKKYPAPAMLTLNWLLGEHNLIIAGGALDQPAGEFIAQRHAGYIWHLLDTEAKTAPDQLGNILSRQDLIMLCGDPDKPGDEGLRGIRKRILGLTNGR